MSLETLSQQRQNARDKLTRLSPAQFQELSTDVYDEMQRRMNNGAPFLPVQDELHPKRNQARQKLATLSKSRFTELVVDVFVELESRFPPLLTSHATTHTTMPMPMPMPMTPTILISNEKKESNGPSTSVQPHPFKNLDALMQDLGNILVAEEQPSKQEEFLAQSTSQRRLSSSARSMTGILTPHPLEKEVEAKNQEINALKSKLE
ncbi:hypothetical protein HMI56_001634, partial [Coelomomyces lativittatus]